MSDKPECGGPSAEFIGDQATEWLLRQGGADWNEDAQAAFDAWLVQSHHHIAAYWRLKAGWSRTERLAALKPAGMHPQKESPRGGRRLWLRFTAIGSAVVIAALVGVYRWTTQEQSVTTAVGQRAKVSLADGSQVELNTDSAVVAHMDLWRRTVVLKRGEAFFNIRHDASRPFTVLAAGHRITDLGTQFSVRTSTDSLRVTLVEGKARLETASSSIQHHATDLTPGDVAIATANSMSVAKMPTRALADGLAWRGGKLIFDHATLEEAAAEFNRYNTTKIIVEPEIADLQINGTFDAASVGPFSTIAKFAFGLRVEKHQSEIVMSR